MLGFGKKGERGSQGWLEGVKDTRIFASVERVDGGQRVVVLLREEGGVVGVSSMLGFGNMREGTRGGRRV